MSYEPSAGHSYELVSEYLEKQDYQSAITSAQTAIRSLVPQPEATAGMWLSQGIALLNMGQSPAALAKFMTAHETAAIVDESHIRFLTQYYVALTLNRLRAFDLTIAMTDSLDHDASPSLRADIRILRAEAYANTDNQLMVKDILSAYYPPDPDLVVNKYLLLWLLANAHFHLGDYVRATEVVNTLASEYRGPAVDYLVRGIQEATHRQHRIKEWG